MTGKETTGLPPMDDEDGASAEAHGRAGPEDELRGLYQRLDAEIARLGPVCQLSGRCCRFREHGHTLFVTALEIEYLLEHAPAPARPLDQGNTCPWQDALGRCTARDARPLGCRAYFCDPGFQETMPVLHEDHLQQLKAIVRRFELPWSYAPLHQHLHELWEAGRWAAANVPAASQRSDDRPDRDRNRSGFSLDSNPSHQYT